MATPVPKIPQRGEAEGDVGAAVLLLGSSSSAFGDDVALRLNSELQWRWWRSSAVHGEMTGGVASSTVVAGGVELQRGGGGVRRACSGVWHNLHVGQLITFYGNVRRGESCASLLAVGENERYGDN